MEKFEIKRVTPQDADFLFKLMNHPLLLARLNEVPTTNQDWVKAVLEWENDIRVWDIPNKQNSH